MAEIIDGKSIAALIRQEVSTDVEKLKTSGKIPGLAVILVFPAPTAATKQSTNTAERIHLDFSATVLAIRADMALGIPGPAFF